MSKVFIFGIDGAPPELLFDKWLQDLPTIRSLMQKGVYAKLNSTIPPVTIIAWNAMMSGKDASEVGVFGYTIKDEQGKVKIVSSEQRRCAPIWEYLGTLGKKSIALYVPLSYPVTPKKNCTLVGGFLTPGVNSKCAYPQKIIDRIQQMPNPETFFDVSVGLAGHKGLEVDELIKKAYEMTDMQLDLLKECMQEEWDFCMSVMIGSDRLQHMLWKHFDETHRKFIPDSPHKNALKEYYIYLDKKVAEFLDMLDEDTTIIVTSDHGMVRQEGKVNINNWLIEQGYMKLKPEVNPQEVQRFSIKMVDCENSTAWGGGAYHARVYLNKEKLGEQYAKVRDEIIRKLKEIPDDSGNAMETKVFITDEIYNDTSSPECPDLLVYFDNLRWASNPDLGMEGLYSWKTAMGADSAGHSPQGSFIMAGKGVNAKGDIGEINIQQVAPTVLHLLGVEKPKDITIEAVEVQ